MVGATRFELATPCTPCRCATRLRYAPTESEIIAQPRELLRNRPHAIHGAQYRPGLAERPEPLAVHVRDRGAAVDARERGVHLDAQGRVASRQRDRIRLE